MKIRILILLSLAVMAVTSCSAPKTFIKTMEPTWTSVELQKDVSFDNAWKETLDILIRKFDIEVSQKENGYIRTGWLYTWTGNYTERYKVRITVKFHKTENIIDIKSEAYYKDRVGYDNRLLQTIKTDIMGTLGRTTR